MARTRLVAEDEEGEPLKIERFTQDMVDEWLLMRLNDMWPNRSESYWRGKIAGIAASNDFLFITNGPAVLCMMQFAHAMTARPLVVEVFGWARAARVSTDGTGDWIVPGQVDRPLGELYRHAREWMRSMKGFRMIAGTCSDLAPACLKDELRGHYMVDAR